MPIAIKDVSLEYKILPIILHENGSSSITIRRGFMDGEVFQIIDGITVDVPIADTNLILDAAPASGLSRRNDLSLAIYTWLVAKGHIIAGTIS